MPACPTPVQMEVPVPLWPTSSPAHASQASQGTNVRLMSMSVTFPDSASTAAPASTSQAPISASAPRASQASTATAPTCPAHPPPVSTEGPAGRLVTLPLSAAAFQVRSPPSVLAWGMHLQREGRGWGVVQCSLRKCPSPRGKRGSENVVWGGLLVREEFYGPSVVHKLSRG